MSQGWLPDFREQARWKSRGTREIPAGSARLAICIASVMRLRPCRRQALRTLGTSAAFLACAAGCAPAPTGPPPVRIPVVSLTPDRRIVVIIGVEPVEVMRTADGIRARVLACTHFGCRVAWDENKRQYACPCHEGRFNDAGEAIAGPPLEPLRGMAFRIEEGDVVISGWNGSS